MSIYPHCEVVGLDAAHGAFAVTLNDVSTECHSQLPADVVVLCTGYEEHTPVFLQNLTPRLQLTAQNRYVVSKDYRVLWNGPDENAIYALNAARHSHGIADSYLCLAAWRAAVVANDILGFERYRLALSDGFIRWDGKPASAHALTRPSRAARSTDDAPVGQMHPLNAGTLSEDVESAIVFGAASIEHENRRI